MLKQSYLLTLTLLLLLISNAAFPQIRCATVEYTKNLKDLKKLRESDVNFEQWLNLRKQIRSSSAQGRTNSVEYRIPVVVHVIHNGEPVGSGANIPDEQILSQIKVLNADFQRNNADTTHTPTQFKSAAGRLNIEFVLAKQDPDGTKTNGIVRVDGNKTSWLFHQSDQFKALSYWPAEDYLNIWVCNITDFLGFAQFPVSDLPGLEDAENNRLTDGVVVWHKSFGSIDDGNFLLDNSYDKGRTATHEVAHFLGLRHIWGDEDNCNGTDFVNDTPPQETFTSGCPLHPHATCSPAVVSMFQNFMDYSDDRCMNLFTNEQVARMEVVLQNSPRRASLLTSSGALPPEPVDNDLGFKRVITPLARECSGDFVPSVEIKNFGINTITSASVNVLLNNEIVSTQNLSLSLAPGDSTHVSFNPVLAEIGSNLLSFEIVLTNGVTDGDDAANENTIETNVLIPQRVQLPVKQGFSGLSSDWQIDNPDEEITWQLTTLPNGNVTNEALMLQFNTYDNTGAEDVLFTPVFDLSDADDAVAYFSIAHASGFVNIDGLRVVALTDCSSLAEGITVYEETGADLARPVFSENYFVPNNLAQWRTEKIDLSSFQGSGAVQLAFIGLNGNGNNLYLDDVIIGSSFTDVKLSAVLSPGHVTCTASSPSIRIQNAGSETVNSIKLRHEINGVVKENMFGGLNLPAGMETTVKLPGIDLSAGEYFLEVSLMEVNGMIDAIAENNALNTKFVLETSTDRIPLRQNFDEKVEGAWTITSPGDGVNFQLLNSSSDFKRSAVYNAFDNPELGDESWLVSPVLDFSQTAAASMVFDVSIGRGLRQDDFKILVSRDCGQTYEQTNYIAPLMSGKTTVKWAPKNSDDWFTKSHLDLTAYAGHDSVRVAFVVTNANGNNAYIDNIEFFLEQEQRQFELESGYAIFGYHQNGFVASDLKIGFDLDNRQNVTCDIIDTMGRQVGSAQWTDVLNQVYELPLANASSAGPYIVRVNIGGKLSTRLVMIPR